MTDNTDTTDVEVTAVEAAATGADAAATLPRHGFFHRLYTGTGAFNVIGRRKLWFGISFLIVAIAVTSIVLRGFTFGIDFQGGTKVSFPVAGVSAEADASQVERVFSEAVGRAPQSVVIVGKGATATVQIRSETLSNVQTNKLRDALFDKFQPKGVDGKASKQAISDSAVSETWAARSPRRPSSRSWCSLFWSVSTSLCATSGSWRSRLSQRWASTWSPLPGSTRWSDSRSPLRQ